MFSNSVKPKLTKLNLSYGTRKWAWKFCFSMATLILVVLSVDGLRFYMVYKFWSARAILGAGQLAEAAPPHEAIVVLTGDIRRIPRAIELMKRRKSEILIISGTKRGITLTELVNRQGDSSSHIHEVWNKIILDSKSGSTLDNAENSGEILKNKNLRHVVLVTSDYHMDRALAVFVRALPGFDILGYAVNSDVHFFKLIPEYWKNTGFRYFGYWY